jgi:hypothetical protein
VRQLLNHGADVNAKDAGLNSALIIGAANPEIVRLLVERGALVNTVNNMGETPLMIAVGKQNDEGIRILVRHGASVNAANNNGKTPLMSAAAEQNIEAVRILVQHGANLNLQDASGYTALMAEISSCPPIEAPPHRITAEGTDSASQAVPPKMSEAARIRLDKAIVITRLLLESGADPNIYAHYDESPLGVSRNRPEQLETSRARHHQIGEHDVHAMRAHLFERVLRVVGMEDAHPLTLEDLLERLDVGPLVVHDEDGEGLCRRVTTL